MINLKLLKIMWAQYNERKLRSFLTVLGIVVGVVALVSLIILSNGLKSGLQSQLEGFRPDEILIAPLAAVGSSQGPSGIGILTQDDLDKIKTIPQIIRVDALLRSNQFVKIGKEKKRLEISSFKIDSTYPDFINLDINRGRYLNSNDKFSINIGYRVAEKLFDKQIVVGSTVKIADKKFKVAGIFAQEGVISKDTIIVMPISVLRDILQDNKAVTAGKLRVSFGVNLDEMEKKIKKTLKKFRKKEDIAVTTAKKIQRQIGSLLNVVDIVIISIALISIIVAALGIMNSLFTSVLQRTKEIGTMKAIGATSYQIMYIFIFESVIMGFVGGIIGVILGAGLAYSIFNLINSFGFVKLIFIVKPSLIIGAILFSMIIGAISGIIPAYRASKLEPVEALRYE